MKPLDLHVHGNCHDAEEDESHDKGFELRVRRDAQEDVVVASVQYLGRNSAVTCSSKRDVPTWDTCKTFLRGLRRLALFRSTRLQRAFVERGGNGVAVGATGSASYVAAPRRSRSRPSSAGM